MTNTGFSGTIDLTVGASRSLALASAIGHASFTLFVWLRFDAVWLAACLSCAAVALGVRSVHGYLCPACSRVRLSMRGEWWVELPDGRPAELIAAPVATPGLTVLRLRVAPDAAVRVVLTDDNVAPDPFRRLRVRLRYR